MTFPLRDPRPQKDSLTWKPAECTGISWPEEERLQSLTQPSSASDFGPSRSRPGATYRGSSAPGSPFLPPGGDRGPGQAPGLSTSLGLS